MDLLPKKGDLKELSKTDTFFKIVLFLFYSNAKNNAEKEWKKFSNDLFYKNRFSTNSKIIQELHDKAEFAVEIIPENKIKEKKLSKKYSNIL